MDTVIHFILCFLLLASSLQLLMTANSLPLPAKENNTAVPLANDSAAAPTDCRCNGTNLMVNGNFLSKWLNPSNDVSRISTITMAAGYLKILTDNKETFGGCYGTYDLQRNYYPESQQVTHDLIKKFYNGLILHQRFIKEVMLVQLRPLRLSGKRNIHMQLASITDELEHNIARLYHLLNITGCDCMQRDCLQADEELASLIRSTEKCFHRNYPVNSVARRIKNDVDSLRDIIAKLKSNIMDRLSPQQGLDHNDDHNTHQYSYSYSTIKATVKSDDDKWCHLI